MLSMYQLIVLLSTAVTLSVARGPMTPSQHKFLKLAFEERIIFFDIPRVVRMSFHDCVGGCDGCLNFDHSGNRGLEEIYEWAKEFRHDFAPDQSLADVIAFLGVEALKRSGSLINRTVEVDYWAGRKDCDSSNGLPVRDLPSHSATNSIQILQGFFNLNEREAVALMGCHSLGGMHRENSGFTLPVTFQGRAPWDRTPIGLDAQLYREMLNGDWIPKQISNDLVNSTFWDKPGSNLMMLNADMAMFKNFTVEGDYDTPSCDVINYTSCPDSTSFKHVLEFASDERAFLDTLGIAFGKMINGRKTGMYSMATAPDYSRNT